MDLKIPVRACNRIALRVDVSPPVEVKMLHTDKLNANANDVDLCQYLHGSTNCKQERHKLRFNQF